MPDTQTPEALVQLFAGPTRSSASRQGVAAMTAVGERWLPVVGFEGLYEVSSIGRVRSIPHVVKAPHGAERMSKGHFLKLRDNGTGYLRAHLSRPGSKPRSEYVHRLVAMAFLGLPAPGQEVCHRDGDRLNNGVANLRWDTHAANMRDAVEAGTHHMTRRKHCPRGHRLELPNLREARLAKGQRICISCDRANKRVLPTGWSLADMADHIYRSLA